jgi:hypothetical protein
MKTLTLFGVAAAGLYFAGFLSFGSWKDAGTSAGLVAIVMAGLALAGRMQRGKLRSQARRSGHSVTRHEHDGIRVFHPDGTQSFHSYR